MKAKTIFILLLLLLANTLSAQNIAFQRDSLGRYMLPVQITEKDTTYLVFLHDLYVFPKPKLKTKHKNDFIGAPCAM